MDYLAWMSAFWRELPGLWTCVLENRYPTSFLTQALLLSPAQAEGLPRYLMGYVAIYFLCGCIALCIHIKKKQLSLNSWSKQLYNVIFTVTDFFFIPMLFGLWMIGRDELALVTPYSGELTDLWRYFSDAWTAICAPLFVFLVTLMLVLFPFQAAYRYLKLYKLFGLPHMVLDVGFGLFLISVLLLAAFYENRLIYLLFLPALVLLALVQRGGYIPDARNLRALLRPDWEEREAKK